MTSRSCAVPLRAGHVLGRPRRLAPRPPHGTTSAEIYCLDISGVSPASCPKDTVSAPFLALPTSCGDPSGEQFESTVTGDSWSGPQANRPVLTLAGAVPVTYTLHDQSDRLDRAGWLRRLEFRTVDQGDPGQQGGEHPEWVERRCARPAAGRSWPPNGDAESDLKNITVSCRKGCVESVGGGWAASVLAGTDRLGLAIAKPCPDRDATFAERRPSRWNRLILAERFQRDRVLEASRRRT